MIAGTDAAWLWLAAFVFVAYGIEAITGFGSIVIALSLGALFLPIDIMLPVLVPLNICMTGYLFVRHRRHVDWHTLGRLILPLMGAGTILGYLLRPWLGDFVLQALFGVLVVWFAGRELWRMRHTENPHPHSRWWTRGWMLNAGLTHGLFASGGPLLVYALSGVALNKARFRATLITVWFTLNSTLTVFFAIDGSLTPALPKIAAMLPILLCGVVLGEWLHHRVDEQRFRTGIFLLLLLTGSFLIAASVTSAPAP